MVLDGRTTERDRRTERQKDREWKADVSAGHVPYVASHSAVRTTSWSFSDTTREHFIQLQLVHSALARARLTINTKVGVQQAYIVTSCSELQPRRITSSSN
jgi:hypothetical protein